jgi:methionyl-tRNA formyltransferase
MQMRIIFFGSDEFAAGHLQALRESGRDISACVVPPDRPRGRGMNVLPSAVKVKAREYGLTVLDPERLGEQSAAARLKNLDPDVLVVIAYGKILPPQVLAMARVMALNVHGSLLPAYRGAAPVNWAIIRGEARTGVSIIKMNAAMDAGDILLQEEMTIHPEDTAETLKARMAGISHPLLLKALGELEMGRFSLKPQNPDKVSLAPKLTKDTGRIVWEAPALAVHNLVRGLSPRPGAFTFWQKKRIRVLHTRVVDGGMTEGKSPGQVLGISVQGLDVQCGQGVLRILSLQPESSKILAAGEFASGYRINSGALFVGKDENR